MVNNDEQNKSFSWHTVMLNLVEITHRPTHGYQKLGRMIMWKLRYSYIWMKCSHWSAETGSVGIP